MNPLMLLTKSTELFQWRLEMDKDSLGFVPTMGNLHEGHLKLVEHALQQHDCVVVSIFVNPKQFGPTEDFAKYPRTLEQDLNLLKNLLQKFPSHKMLNVFAPSGIEEVFPQEFSTQISLKSVTQILCGKSRPTHFDGVTTVVYRLFAMVRPTHAYFGLKDFQQQFIIKKMAHDLLLPVEVVALPTQRDHDGLALSSRNQYLSPEQRAQAPRLYQALQSLADRLKQGLNQADELRGQLIKENSFEYLEILDAQSLAPASNSTKQVVILGAWKLGQTRLIDNILLEVK